jgi:shikimate 5-dehydrogenase
LITHKAEHYKLAVEVRDMVELWQGHQWYLEDPTRRSFMPVSADGRWNWYRLSHGRKMQIKFVREGFGSAPDQPTLFDWIRVQKTRVEPFAAILGDPVDHSRTPAEQNKFFADKNMAVLSLRMPSIEFNEISLGILRRLGLTNAAVTAPLKEKAFALCTEVTGEARALQSVNTLRWDSHLNAWAGTNTDIVALRTVLGSMALPDRVAVWGGGGTIAVLSQLLPNAQFYSARTGEQRSPETSTAPAAATQPQMVIWAVGRARMESCQYPPPEWRPHLVFDLNYSDDSPGREYALRAKARYISGIEMFHLQAQAQREFWKVQFVGEQLRPNL